MIAFTIIGLLFFWWFCWEVGYMVAMACDALAKWDEFLKPIKSELETLVEAVDVWAASAHTREGER